MKGETPLEMTARHVREGTGRVIRQQSPIAELRAHGRSTEPQAEIFLAEFDQTQA
jgi:hypothetical protein